MDEMSGVVCRDALGQPLMTGDVVCHIKRQGAAVFMTPRRIVKIDPHRDDVYKLKLSIPKYGLRSGWTSPGRVIKVSDDVEVEEQVPL